MSLSSSTGGDVGDAACIITHGPHTFLITEAPADCNLDKYVALLKKNNISHVVRTCAQTYSSEDEFTSNGIKIHNMEYPDGTFPSEKLINRWRNIRYETNGRLAIYCVAGLGRAPTLVAIALVEMGLDSLQAVEKIRRKRKGAINHQQLVNLTKYDKQFNKNNTCIVS